ncbi:MAG: hypothetical protein RIQ52_1903, partial [Pseudomonadota bacterium]
MKLLQRFTVHFFTVKTVHGVTVMRTLLEVEPVYLASP